MQAESVKQLEELLDTSLLPALLSQLPSRLIDVAIYIVTALAIYTIARRRGIQKAWLAWIPVVNVWVLGCISDQYRDVALGQIRRRRGTLLGLNIVMCLLGIMMLVALVFVAGGVLLLLLVAPTGTEAMMDQLISSINSTLPVLAGILLIAIPLSVVVITYWVFYFMALHDLFKSCDPANATLFTLLSVFISISLPVFLFLCRHKDEGMPPRQTEPVYMQEPWVQ